MAPTQSPTSGVDLSAIDLNLMILFEAVFSAGNVGRAAARLNLTQPSASNGLARLRRQLDDPLFTRTVDGVTPTARAQRLIGPVREALGVLTSGLGRNTIDPATYQRQFRIIMADTCEPNLMPPVIRTLTERAPGISILSVPTPTGDFTADMRAGLLDLAVYSYPADTSDIVMIPLVPVDLVIISRRNHPGIGNKFDADTFSALPHLTLTPELRARTQVPRDLAAQGVERRSPYSVAKIASMPAIVAQTDLIAFAARRFAEKMAMYYDIDIHELPVPIAQQHCYLIWHERSTDDPGHKWLRDQLIEAARSQMKSPAVQT